ncbi:signal recognition particle-docking protein FtsY [Helicobacter sp. faydin-H20]|uniref:signal recognition particle-docking protein FtsY n=1 Tax=Helicobacter anatolicus TaxID=2905874 RepID=UPI001E57DC97|nr:signal recognition particle-docking protein FtsY [Helicobacter anatolicus]MCE3037160.1 signal recognition particle-docking protein FtsY [Helicobacter anatolicus]
MFSFLKKTTQNIANILGSKKQEIKKDLLEEVLIESDVDYDLIEMLLEHLPENINRTQLEVGLDRFFRGESYYDKVRLEKIEIKPLVELIIGVNGAGKTTTIAKLAKRYKDNHKKVLLGAGDTFRAAAIDQLKLWSQKIGVDLVSTQYGSDPSALAFDAITAGIAREMDHVIIDTAGRLHNQTNLKNELLKITKVCSKALNDAKYRKILVLDGTQGSSSINQARIFHEMLSVDGVIITKLDGTSKGGAILSIIYALKLPIIAIGVGEKAEDLIDFDEQKFIKEFLDSIFENK